MERDENSVQSSLFSVHNRIPNTATYHADDISPFSRGNNALESSNIFTASSKQPRRHIHSLSSSTFGSPQMKVLPTPSSSPSQTLARSHQNFSRKPDNWVSLNSHVEVGSHRLHITYLAIESVILSDSPWNWLLTVIPQLTNLRHLSLKETEMTDQRLQGFLGTVCYTVSRGSPTPESIMVANANGSEILSGVTSHSIANTSLSQLESFDISCNELTSKSALSISKFMMWNLENLKGLSLASNNIGDHGAQILAVYISKMAPLVVASSFLHKSNSCKRKDIDSAYMKNSRSHSRRSEDTKSPKGSRLNYTRARLDGEELKDIEKKLNNVMKMVRPSTASVRHGNSPSLDVAQILLSNYPLLTTVNAKYYFRREGENKQAKYRARDSLGLMALDVSNNRISHKGASEILLAASKAMDLRVVLINSKSSGLIEPEDDISSQILSHRQHQRTPFQDIFHELHRPNKLRCISLQNYIRMSETGYSGMRKLLLSILFACDNLKVFDLSGNYGIGDVFCRLMYDIGWHGMESGKPIPRSLSSIVAIDLSNTGMTDAGAETLIHALVDFHNISSSTARVRGEDNGQFGTSILCNLLAINFDQDNEEEGLSDETYRNLCSFFTEQDDAVMVGPLKEPFIPQKANRCSESWNNFDQVSLLDYAVTLHKKSSEAPQQKRPTVTSHPVIPQYNVSRVYGRRKLFSPSIDDLVQPSNDCQYKQFECLPSQLHQRQEANVRRTMAKVSQISHISPRRIIMSPGALDEESSLCEEYEMTHKNLRCENSSDELSPTREPPKTPTPLFNNSKSPSSIKSRIVAQDFHQVSPILKINSSVSDQTVIMSGFQIDGKENHRSVSPRKQRESSIRWVPSKVQADYQISNKSSRSPSHEKRVVDSKNHHIPIGFGNEMAASSVKIHTFEKHAFHNAAFSDNTTDVSHPNESIPVSEEISKELVYKPQIDGLPMSVSVEGLGNRSSSLNSSSDEGHQSSKGPSSPPPDNQGIEEKNRTQRENHQISIITSRESSFRKSDDDIEKEEFEKDNNVPCEEKEPDDRDQSPDDEIGAYISGDVSLREERALELSDGDCSFVRHLCSEHFSKDEAMELSLNSASIRNAFDEMEKQINEDDGMREYDQLSELTDKSVPLGTKSVKSAGETLPFYLSTLSPYQLYFPPTKDPNDLQGRIKNFKLTYTHPPGHLLCIVWHALHAPQHSINLWEQRVEKEVNESSKKRFLSLLTKCYLIAQEEYECKGKSSLRRLLLSPPVVETSVLKQFFIDSIQRRADSIHAAIVSDVSRFLQPLENEGDEDVPSLSNQERSEHKMSTSKVVEDISMETDELMGSCTFSISTNERRSTVSSRLHYWANIGYDALNSITSFNFDLNEINISKSTDEIGEIDESGWPALQHYIKRCMYYTPNGDEYQADTDVSTCPAPPFTQSEVQWAFFLEKAIKNSCENQQQEIGSQYPSIQHLLHEYHGREGELVRELPEDVIQDVTTSMYTLCDDMLATENALENTSFNIETDNKSLSFSYKSRSSEGTHKVRENELLHNKDALENSSFNNETDNKYLCFSYESSECTHKVLRVNGSEEIDVEEGKLHQHQVTSGDYGEGNTDQHTNDNDDKSNANSKEEECHESDTEEAAVYANTKDEDLVPFPELLRRRHEQQLSFDMGKTALPSSETQTPRTEGSVPMISDYIRSPFAKSPRFSTTGNDTPRSKSRSLLNNDGRCDTARNCEENKIAERLAAIRQRRAKGIQKLCYQSLNLGYIPLNDETRKKRRITRGTLLGAKGEGHLYSGESKKEEVSISVEWEELLVIKQYRGLSSKSLRLVHPLSAEGLLIIHPTDSVARGSLNKEIVITIEQHYTPEELNVTPCNNKDRSKSEARILSPRRHPVISDAPGSNSQTNVTEVDTTTSPYRSEFANTRVISITVAMKTSKEANSAVRALQSAIVKAKEHFDERVREALEKESNSVATDEGHGEEQRTLDSTHIYNDYTDNHPVRGATERKVLPTPPE